jgi:hypothetical protein
MLVHQAKKKKEAHESLITGASAEEDTSTATA